MSLVGTFDHTTQFAQRFPRQTDHHLYVWLENPLTGEIHECAVNTRQSQQSRMQVCYMRQPCEPAEWPEFGTNYDVTLSYFQDLDLKQADFREIQRASLVDELAGLLASCSRVQVYGFSYDTASGVRRIRMNSGETSGSVRPDCPGQDGALVLYYNQHPGHRAHALWVCLKFGCQELRPPTLTVR